MIYDEVTGEYKPRWGYKAINNGIEDHAIVEVKTGQDPFADPWAVEKNEKKERVQKNLKKQLKNTMRGSDGKIIKPTYGKKIILLWNPNSNYYITNYLYILTIDPVAVPGIPLNLNNNSLKRGKDGVRKALQLVQHSTASMGRYRSLKIL